MHDFWQLEIYIYLRLLSRFGCKYYKKYNAVSAVCGAGVGGRLVRDSEIDQQERIKMHLLYHIS